MTVYIIKHKGADWWGNYRHDRKITISNTKIYVSNVFFRLKDAKLFLETYGENKKYFEIKRFTS